VGREIWLKQGPVDKPILTSKRFLKKTRVKVLRLVFRLFG
jgi:hypothetical protein